MHCRSSTYDCTGGGGDDLNTDDSRADTDGERLIDCCDGVLGVLGVLGVRGVVDLGLLCLPRVGTKPDESAVSPSADNVLETPSKLVSVVSTEALAIHLRVPRPRLL